MLMHGGAPTFFLGFFRNLRESIEIWVFPFEDLPRCYGCYGSRRGKGVAVGLEFQFPGGRLPSVALS
jgi:hypothetical protein